METIRFSRTIVVLFCALLVAIWITLRRNAPPLRIVQNGPKLIVNISTLGEYPTTVKRVRLSDMKNIQWSGELSADGFVPHYAHYPLTQVSRAARNSAILHRL